MLLVQQKWTQYTMRGVEACVEKFSNREGLGKVRLSKQIIIVHFLDFKSFCAKLCGNGTV